MQLELHQQQFPAEAHRKVRHRRAKEATERADADTPTWSQRAYDYLVMFAKQRKEDFLGEEVIYSSRSAGVPDVADRRAWGSCFSKAARNGVIRRVGWSTATKNSSAKPVWRGT